MPVPYEPHMRPCLGNQPLDPLDPRRVVGLECPVCELDAIEMAGPLDVHADGSATARCPRCRAPLRQNPEGFVFLGRYEEVFPRCNPAPIR